MIELLVDFAAYFFVWMWMTLKLLLTAALIFCPLIAFSYYLTLWREERRDWRESSRHE